MVQQPRRVLWVVGWISRRFQYIGAVLSAAVGVRGAPMVTPLAIPETLPVVCVAWAPLTVDRTAGLTVDHAAGAHPRRFYIPPLNPSCRHAS